MVFLKLSESNAYIINSMIIRGNAALTISLSEPSDLLSTIGLTAIKTAATKPARFPDIFFPIKKAAIIAKKERNRGVRKATYIRLIFDWNIFKMLYRTVSIYGYNFGKTLIPFGANI